MDAVGSAMGLGIVVRAKDMASNTFDAIRLKMWDCQYAAEELNQKFKNGIQGITSGLTGLAAAVGIAFSFSEIAKTSDMMTKFKGRIDLVTKSAQDTKKVMEELMDIAQAGGVSVSPLMDLFATAGLSMKDAGFSNKDVIGFTETMTQLSYNTGMDSTANESLLRNLNQAMSSGSFKGKDFSDIRNIGGMPVLKEIARGMGMTLEQMQDAATAGTITTQQMVLGIQNIAEETRNTFNNMPKTIEGGMGRVKNAWVKMVAAFQEKTGVFTLIANGFTGLSKAMEWLISGSKGAQMALAALTMGFYKLGKIIVIAKLKQWEITLEVAKRSMMGFTTSLYGAVAPFAALMIAGFLLKKAWENDFAGIRRLVDIFRVSWEIASMAAEDGTVRFKESMLDAVGGIGNLSRIKEVAKWFFRVQKGIDEFGNGLGSTLNWVANKVEWFSGVLSGLGSTEKPAQGLIDLLTGVGKTDTQQWKDVGLSLGMIAGWIPVVLAGFVAYKTIMIAIAVATGAYNAVMLVWKGITLVGAAVQWVLNAAFMGFPVMWIVAGILLLGTVIYLLYSNWESIWGAIITCVSSAVDAIIGFFVWLGEGIYNIIVTAVSLYLQPWIYLGTALYNIVLAAFNAVVNFLSGLGSTFYKSGAALWEAFTSGLKSMIDGPYTVVLAGLKRLRDLLPFSDAKEGPLSTLTLSGTRLMTTIGDGIDIGAPKLLRTVENKFNQLPILGEDKNYGSTASLFSKSVNDSRQASNPEGRSEPEVIIIENKIILDGDVIYKDVKQKSRYDQLREGKDDA